MNYSRIRHLELLKRSQDFENQGKSFSREKEKEYLELCKYRGALQSHVYWKIGVNLLY